MPKAKLNRFCWARDLGGCSADMSQEHVLSQAVNRSLGESLCVNLRGPGPRRIGAHAQSLGILCATHNQMLSDLDTEAGNFIAKLLQYFNSERRLDRGAPPLCNIDVDGTKFERWGLKTYFNHTIWSGCMGMNLPSSDITGHRIRDYVFTGKPQPADSGLFVGPCTKILTIEDMNRDKGNIFSMDTYSSEVSVFRPSVNAVVHRFRLPTHLALTLFGVTFGFSANITPYDDLFQAHNFGSVQNLLKGAELRPDGIVMLPREPESGPENFTRLVTQLHW